MNNNKVELIGFYGDDLTHALSAWTSTSRNLDEEKLQRVPKLLKMLAHEGHHTPFEKSSLHFLVTCDQASHIHLLKHRIGTSINAESARYKELKEDKFYLPEDWEGIESRNIYSCSIDGGKSGSANIDNWLGILNDFTQQSNYLYHQCLEELTHILGRKRAKESARFFKTMNSQITMDVMFNFRSFAHFLSLRNKPEAQKEIREIAQQMLELLKNIEGNPFQHSIRGFELDILIKERD
jgi:thymidylate synthase (FAD)